MLYRREAVHPEDAIAGPPALVINPPLLFINGLNDVADKAEKLSEVKITPAPTDTLDSVVENSGRK